MLQRFFQSYIPGLLQRFLRGCFWKFLQYFSRISSEIALIFSQDFSQNSSRESSFRDSFREFFKDCSENFSKISNWICPKIFPRIPVKILPGFLLLILQSFLPRFLQRLPQGFVWDSFQYFSKISSKIALWIPRRSPPGSFLGINLEIPSRIFPGIQTGTP